MPHTHTGGRGPAAAALLILLLACIGLAACGSSSSTTSTSANAASTGTSPGASSSTSSTATTPTGSATALSPAGRGSARFAAMRECLQKNGITLPARPSGSTGPRGARPFLGAGGAATLPKGVTRAQYEVALKKCGGGRFAGGGHFGRINSPAFRQALGKYAACLNQNGVKVAAPNTTGRGPIFNTKGINTASPQFRAAATKCRGTLVGAFRGGPQRAGGTPGAGGAPNGGAAPGAGGPPPGGESSG